MTDDSESENKDTDLTSPHLEDAGNKVRSVTLYVMSCQSDQSYLPFI